MKLPLVLFLTATTTHAQDAGELDAESCLSANTVVTATFSKDTDRAIDFTVTNNLPFTIVGAQIEFEIVASNRPTPLYSSHVRPTQEISGGLLSNETAIFTEFHFMNERENQLAADAPELYVVTSFVDAALLDGTTLTGGSHNFGDGLIAPLESWCTSE